MMGFGLAGLGAAVGGAAEGYMRGEKHRSEMEDAEARRGLVKLQTEKGQLELDEAKEQRALRDKSRSIVQRYLPLIGGEEGPTEGAPAAAPVVPAAADAVPVPATTEAPAAATPAPAAAPVQAAAPAARPAGIATPSERVTASPASTPKMSRWDALQKMYNELNLAGLNANPQNWEKSLETALSMSRKFSDAKTDASIRALQSYNGTNDQEVMQALSQAGINLPEGTKFEKVKSEAVPNSGMFFDDIRATSPDGKQTVTLGELMRKRLDAKEWMSMSNDLGYKAADLTLKRAAEENLKNYRQRTLDLRAMEVEATIQKYKNDNKVAMARLEQIAEERRDALTARAMKDRQTASDTALDTLLKGFGISKNLKESDLIMLPKERQAEIRKNLGIAFNAHAVWEMNVSPDNKQSFSPSEAPNVLRQIAATPANKFEIDANGVFTTYQGKKVYAPIDPNAVREAKGEKPQAAAGAPSNGGPVNPAPAETATRPAAIAPPTMQETQAQFRAAGAYVGRQKEAAAADADLRELKLRQDQAMRNGRAAEVNNIMAQRAQILRDRYNLTSMGGIADPSKIGQQ
jgi:hypothetical protein